MNEALYYTATPENQDLEYEMVMSTDYEAACDERDAAVDELTALREELAEWKARAGRRTAERTEFMNERDDARQRLAATEQRNAELVELLGNCKSFVGNHPMSHLSAYLYGAIEAALKPTESGASE